MNSVEKSLAKAREEHKYGPRPKVKTRAWTKMDTMTLTVSPLMILVSVGMAETLHPLMFLVGFFGGIIGLGHLVFCKIFGEMKES